MLDQNSADRRGYAYYLSSISTYCSTQCIDGLQAIIDWLNAQHPILNCNYANPGYFKLYKQEVDRPDSKTVSHDSADKQIV
ncbi:hypothetical protein D3C81_2165290 [compost metagenome]